MAFETTIAALSTAAAPGGIAVIRISGESTKALLQAVFQSKTPPESKPRTLVYGACCDPHNNGLLDHCMAVFMPAPRSFTGEDVAEFHIHGSPLLARKILRLLYSLGATPAEPGEFTKRAFLNNKLDLIQAEAIGDVITASSDEGLRIAQEQLAGRLSSVLDNIGEPLRNVLAEIEAHIDFPEEDISPDSISKSKTAIDSVSQQIQGLIRTYDYGQVVRDGFRVLLFGKPNVGKSSLLNYFLGNERAIVTNVAGTTRDILEEQATIDGLPFIFCDTAGITETEDVVEKIGIARAQERIAWADVLLYLVDSSNPDPLWCNELERLSQRAKNIWLVFSKSDLCNLHEELKEEISEAQPVFSVSLSNAAQCQTLSAALVRSVHERVPSDSAISEVLTNERHRLCLEKSNDALKQALNAISETFPLEVIAAEIRIALNALQELIGVTDTEDILGRIFSKFCIGK